MQHYITELFFQSSDLIEEFLEDPVMDPAYKKKSALLTEGTLSSKDDWKLFYITEASIHRLRRREKQWYPGP